MTELRVVTWNVLADAYLRPDWFPNLPERSFRPGARADQVVEAISRIGADVVALQEAEPELVRRLEDAGIGMVLWCKKGLDRPDGCAMVVRDPWLVDNVTRIDYRAPRNGHVAQVVHVRSGPTTIVVANTHLKGDDHHPPAVRISAIEAEELVGALSGPAIVLADTNDLPGGPARLVFQDAGFTEVQTTGPTSLFDATRPRAIDIVAIRGGTGTPLQVTRHQASGIPSAAFPSDHLPIGAACRFQIQP